MSSEDLRTRSESQSFYTDVTEYVQESVRWEKLLFLLAEDISWENFVTKADLSRQPSRYTRNVTNLPQEDSPMLVSSTQILCLGEEEYALREYLSKLQTVLAREDQDSLQKWQQEKERFLTEFPRVKQELEENIKKLRERADSVDKVHRDCTISNVVASSTGVVSGALGILGLVLAPFTAGLSLGLSATGIGLGAAAAVTGLSTMVVESVNTSSAETQASRLDNSGIKSYRRYLYKVKDVGRHIRAIKVARGNPQLVATAQRYITNGRVSVQSAKQVRRHFGGTALAETRTARIGSGVVSGLFMALDVYSLVKDAQHLQEGAKTASAKNMRQKAQELETMLEELTWIYECLQ